LISDDTAPALPVIAHAVDWLEANANWSAEAIAYLQPTSPFRDASDIERAVALLQERFADTVVSVVAVPHNMSPSSLMQVREGWLEFCVPPEQRSFRRQSKEQLFARNGPAILLNRRDVIDRGELYGARIAPLEMSRLASLDIDEPEDLVLAESLLPLVMSRRQCAG
jgi:CMP-N-acetylneuraminic acid synthetase